MSQPPAPCPRAPSAPEVEQLADRIFRRIASDLLELSAVSGVDVDLFAAGLDSMAIMQIILMLEQEFGVHLPDVAVTRQTFATARSIAQAALTAGAAP
jgi:acyl carrier protein